MNKCVKYVVIDGCRLHFYNELPTAYNTPTGSLISSIDLIGLNFTQSATQIVFGSIVLDKSSLPPIIIGYNTPPVPFDLALIEAAIAMCGEPEPIIVDALNCDNTTTPTEVTQRVAIVAEKPIKVCIDGLTETVVYEKYCDIETGEVVGYAVLETTETVPPITAAKWFDLTFAPIAGMPAGAKVCSVIDVELFSNCYQDATDNSIKYTAVSLLNVGVTPIVSVGTIWYNAAGVVIAAPINVEPCAAPTEFDVVPSNWLPLCVDGVQWYVRESQVIDNNLGTVTITNKEYKQGANGTIVTTAPTGTTITEGVCEAPKKAIFEKDVCVTIDGSPENYEVIKVYHRDQATGVSTLLHYETKAGIVLTGTIVEVCCDCDSVCDVPTNTANKVAFGYATLFNGRMVAGDRILLGEEVYLDYLEVDGNVLVSSPRLLGITTGGFTATDMGYGIGYNKIIDVLNTAPEFAANGVRFVTAAAPIAPNGASYDPMMWGIEYDDTKDVRIVLRDSIVGLPYDHSFSIRLNVDPLQTYDGLANVVSDAGNNWDFNNVSSFFNTFQLQNITSI